MLIKKPYPLFVLNATMVLSGILQVPMRDVVSYSKYLA